MYERRMGSARALTGLLLFILVGVCDELRHLGLCHVLGLHAVLLLLVSLLLLCRKYQITGDAWARIWWDMWRMAVCFSAAHL